jgi:hypothetical protein
MSEVDFTDAFVDVFGVCNKYVPPKPLNTSRQKMGKTDFEDVSFVKGYDEHRALVLKTLEQYKGLGYDVYFERSAHCGTKRWFIDITLLKGDEVILIEIGNTPRAKLEDLRRHYPVVIHVPYGEDYKRQQRERNNARVRKEYWDSREAFEKQCKEMERLWEVRFR